MISRAYFIVLILPVFMMGCSGDYKIPVGYKNQTSAQCYDPVKQNCTAPIIVQEPVPLIEEKEMIKEIVVDPTPKPTSNPSKRTQSTKGRPLFKGTAIIQ